jgi:hypothetical protein
VKTHFTLVAEPGSGEGILVEALQFHPSVRMHLALFTRSDYATMDALSRQGLLIRVKEDPIDFLEAKVLTDHDPDVRAIGFVLNYNHARSESWSKVWRYVRKGFKVLHFKRRNLIDRFLEGRTKAAHVEPTELERVIKASLDSRRENDIYFKHTDTMEVYLEDLVADPAGVMSEVHEFLDISDEVVEVAAPVGIDRELLILNYHDLQAHFTGKPCEEYFK